MPGERKEPDCQPSQLAFAAVDVPLRYPITFVPKIQSEDPFLRPQMTFEVIMSTNEQIIQVGQIVSFEVKIHRHCVGESSAGVGQCVIEVDF